MRGFKTRTTFYRRTIACVCTLLVLFLLIKACIEAHPGWMIAIQGVCFGSLVTMMVVERRISDAYVEAGGHARPVDDGPHHASRLPDPA